MASSTEYTFVLANGSARILPAMVKADIEDFPLLRQYLSKDLNQEPLQSLNGTKLQVEHQEKFATKKHYEDYFKHLNLEILNVKHLDCLIAKTHIFSGGVLRSMREELSSYSAKYSVLLNRWRKKYPAQNTVEYAIFQALAAKYVRSHHVTNYNVFDMPTLSEQELLQKIKDFDSLNNFQFKSPYQTLQKLIEGGVLEVRRDGISPEYTYGCPAYFLLSLSKPMIFISHRWDAKKTNGTFVVCEDLEEQSAIAKCGIETWQAAQSVVTVPKYYRDIIQRAGIVLINEPYLLRLETYKATNEKNGCSVEFERF